MRRTYKSFLAAFLISLTILSACSKQKETTLPIVRIGHASHDHHSSVFIAAAKPDYFRENGNVYLREVVPEEAYILMVDNKPRAQIILERNIGGKELIRKLSEDHYDLAFGGIGAMLYYIDQGAPIKIAAPVMGEGAGLLVNNNLPVKNWDEFVALARTSNRPIRIGYKIAFSQNLIMEHALRDEGLSYSETLNDTKVDVQLLNLYGPKNLIPALKSGIIDGFVVNQPLLALAESQSVGKTVALLADMPPLGKWHDHPCCTLNIRESFYKTYPNISEELTAMFMRANKFIVNNREQSAEILAGALDLPITVENESLKTIKFQTNYTDQWEYGVDFMINSLAESGRIGNRVAKASRAGIVSDVIYQRDLYDNAQRRISDK